ncbi:hypothetical protein J1605_013447 [Eschrichtius robustus]|uniref:Ras-associating domain-containing protein n=1 Tax=Eschrichtius robustus TaxID=9764 RepID=A0AB34GJV6_ESCRO|nr:hypothetical protein J1605_013447 [Eschrichtius robustus]
MKLLAMQHEEVTNEHLMELEAQRKDEERQEEEEVTEEQKRFAMQEMARGFSLSEEALLVFEAQDPNVERYAKVAAVQNAIQCYRVIYDEKKKSYYPDITGSFFQEGLLSQNCKPESVVAVSIPPSPPAAAVSQAFSGNLPRPQVLGPSEGTPGAGTETACPPGLRPHHRCPERGPCLPGTVGKGWDTLPFKGQSRFKMPSCSSDCFFHAVEVRGRQKGRGVSMGVACSPAASGHPPPGKQLYMCWSTAVYTFPVYVVSVFISENPRLFICKCHRLVLQDVKVFSEDGTSKVVEILVDTTARDLCQLLVYRSHCVDDNSWTLVEHHPHLGLGRNTSGRSRNPSSGSSLLWVRSWADEKGVTAALWPDRRLQVLTPAQMGRGEAAALPSASGLRAALAG